MSKTKPKPQHNGTWTRSPLTNSLYFFSKVSSYTQLARTNTTEHARGFFSRAFCRRASGILFYPGGSRYRPVADDFNGTMHGQLVTHMTMTKTTKNMSKFLLHFERMVGGVGFKAGDLQLLIHVERLVTRFFLHPLLYLD